jgi:5-methylthioadenosine/S-adenosylhomocysteine deaminase
MIDLLVDGGFVYTGEDLLTDGAVAVDGRTVVAVGPSDRLRAEYDAETLIDASGRAVLPGLVNAHTHECLPRGFHEDLPLMEWLETSTLPAERALTPDQMEAAARLNQAEMIRSGTTTFAEIFRHQDVAADVARETGMRAIVSSQAIDDPYEIETVEANRKVFEQYHGAADGRIQVWFGVHAPYTCHEETMVRAAELADRYDTRLHTHLAETESEVDQIDAEHGLTPVEYLDELGLLTERLHAAHCVHLTDEDVRLLADRGVSVAYNPVSNMKLADGVAPVLDLLAADVPVGLATDSNLSNNNLDMFEEMRIGSYVQKLHTEDPAAMSYELLLELATEGAARSLGLESVGRLAPGWKADIITVSLDAPHLRPVFPEQNLLANLVYAGNGADVVDTIVDGAVLMRDRELLTIDEEAVFDRAQTAARELNEAVQSTN